MFLVSRVLAGLMTLQERALKAEAMENARDTANKKYLQHT